MHAAQRKICLAALHCFAERGVQVASLRSIAQAAGVSVGLVQHHFGTKSALVEAVDNEVAAALTRAVAQTHPSPRDPADHVSQTLNALIAEGPDTFRYLLRQVIDNQPAGQRLFDLLLDNCESQWAITADLPEAKQGHGSRWEVLAPLAHVLSTLMLKSHLERHLPEPLHSPAQMQAWKCGVAHLIRGVQPQAASHQRLKSGHATPGGSALTPALDSKSNV